MVKEDIKRVKTSKQDNKAINRDRKSQLAIRK
jgi:hypothetical protein